MSLDAYEGVVGSVVIAQLRKLAHQLSGARVVHVNSTKEGGGVAEILKWLVPLMNDLGLDTSWEVINGHTEYFNTTKSFHNGLQGSPAPLTDRMIKVYEETVRENAERLCHKLSEADFVIIHDPQPAHLIRCCPKRKGRWVWRCHIDVSRPNRRIWRYLEEMVSLYAASIYSMPHFARRLDHPQLIIAPSIDPLSDKNCELPQDYIDDTLDHFGLDSRLPMLTQISRFDRFKDPIGVIRSFDILRTSMDAQLVLAGGGATDDPEGQAVLNEVQEAAGGRDDIFVLDLPPDAHKIINALQRASTVVIQKSLQEGFGLTVTEAMWKSKPVIGGNVGGIRLQVHNYHTGFLVDTPEGAALRLRELLRQPGKVDRMGRTAREFVRVNFLLTRHLREYLTLMLGLRHGLESHLLAG